MFTELTTIRYERDVDSFIEALDSSIHFFESLDGANGAPEQAGGKDDFVPFI